MSAPQSASTPRAAGPAIHTPSSTTFTPSSGPDMAVSLASGRSAGRTRLLHRRPLQEDDRLGVVDLAALDHRQGVVERQLDDLDVLALVGLATARRHPLLVGV